MAKRKADTAKVATKRGATRAKPRSSKPKSYQTLTVDVRNQTALIALARPDVHNSFNRTLTAELTAALRAADADDAVRAVVLLGHGSTFCAGADLTWMKEMAGYDFAENLADATAVATIATPGAIAPSRMRRRWICATSARRARSTTRSPVPPDSTR